MNAIMATSKTFQLVRKEILILEAEGKYILPLKRIVESFRRLDPPPTPQMAIPVDVPEVAIKLWHLTPNARKRATEDLTNILFYYLFRNGEYTKPRKVKRNGKMVIATRTVQFPVYGIGFWKDNKILSRHLPLDMLIQADSATMKISNNKNGQTGQNLHQESTGANGAAASLAWRVHHILSNGGTKDQLMCNVYYKDVWVDIYTSEIVGAVRMAAKSLKLQDRGIYLDLIGAHSLRAGRAMALKIMGYADSKIRKFGCWTSDKWMMFIHSQISKFYKCVAQKMSKPITFHNIAFIETPTMQNPIRIEA